jgi:hypothetical protein
MIIQLPRPHLSVLLFIIALFIIIALILIEGGTKQGDFSRRDYKFFLIFAILIWIVLESIYWTVIIFFLP